MCVCVCSCLLLYVLCSTEDCHFRFLSCLHVLLYLYMYNSDVHVFMHVIRFCSLSLVNFSPTEVYPLQLTYCSFNVTLSFIFLSHLF